MPSPVTAMKESPGDWVRILMRSDGKEESVSSLMAKKALALVMKSGEEKFSMPSTTLCVGRMVMPGASMLTKVIIMAASGKAGVGELPDAVNYAVLVGYCQVGGVCVEIFRASGFVGSEDEFFGGEGGIGVEHVDLLAVGAGGLEEGEAVGLVLGKGLLVAVDDLCGVIVEVAEGDEAAALAGLVGSGNGVGLGVAVDGGL